MASATARLVLHYVTLGYRALDLWREQCNALWPHLTQHQLDPCTSYKRKSPFSECFVNFDCSLFQLQDMIGQPQVCDHMAFISQLYTIHILKCYDDI